MEDKEKNKKRMESYVTIEDAKQAERLGSLPFLNLDQAKEEKKEWGDRNAFPEGVDRLVY
jgi:hypothetical protein